MTAIITKPIPVQPSRLDAPAEDQRLVLHDISWETYLALGNALADRPALRLTFDRGTLEFMTTSPRHEIYKKWLGRMVEILAEEFEKPLATAGNTTFQKEPLDRGLEPDDCFWITHERQMRGKLTWDPLVDPPPDLALEIEISRTVVSRMSIYAALRVPEVWCFDGATLRVYRLGPDGGYHQSEESQFFPGVAPAELARFLNPQGDTDYLGAMRAFRGWLQQVLGKKSQE